LDIIVITLVLLFDRIDAVLDFFVFILQFTDSRLAPGLKPALIPYWKIVVLIIVILIVIVIVIIVIIWIDVIVILIVGVEVSIELYVWRGCLDGREILAGVNLVVVVGVVEVFDTLAPGPAEHVYFVIDEILHSELLEWIVGVCVEVELEPFVFQADEHCQKYFTVARTVDVKIVFIWYRVLIVW